MMSKKHYVRIAAALKEERDCSERDDIRLGVDYAAKRLADVCAQDNPKFDRARFLAACGVVS